MSHDYRKTTQGVSALTNTQYEVTQQDGTEPPFRNAYWNNHDDGIYVDVEMCIRDSDWSVEQSTLSLLLGAAGSLIGALAVIGGLLGWVRTTTKNPRLLGWSVPIGLALVGAGLGLLLMGQTVVALSLLGVGVVLGALGVVVRGRRSARLDVEEEIMRTSAPVTGQVTNQGYTHFGDSSRILTSVTYAFSDAQGTRRFVQRSAMIEADDPILEGESVDVWYDRQDPSNEKRIVVRRRR